MRQVTSEAFPGGGASRLGAGPWPSTLSFVKSLFLLLLCSPTRRPPGHILAKPANTAARVMQDAAGWPCQGGPPVEAEQQAMKGRGRVYWPCRYWCASAKLRSSWTKTNCDVPVFLFVSKEPWLASRSGRKKRRKTARSKKSMRRAARHMK